MNVKLLQSVLSTTTDATTNGTASDTERGTCVCMGRTGSEKLSRCKGDKCNIPRRDSPLYLYKEYGVRTAGHPDI